MARRARFALGSGSVMTSDALRFRIVPLVVACPLFLQNLDTSVMTTALPAMAASLHVRPLDLNLAIASYVLSLAIFLPASAWLASRFGARRVFCAAVALFSLSSALCGLAGSLPELVAWRMLQGMGGAMMVPVGRSILLNNVPAERMVSAMVWFTMPGVIGRMAGPLFGGAIVTVASWHWIFLVNIPFGLLGIAMAWWVIAPDAPPLPDDRESIDLVGLGLLAVGLAGLLGSLELAGKNLLPPVAVAALLGAGIVSFALYLRHARRVTNPVLDFSILRFPVYRIAVLGSLPLRVAAMGAAPFLLPLMLQVGFGLSPMASGTVTVFSAVGGLCTRFIMVRAIGAWGFRRLLVGSAFMAALLYALYALFTPATPAWLMAAALFTGGLCTSMTMVSLNTVGYADMPRSRVGHATAMSSMVQQLSLALGVVLGAYAVTWTGLLRHGSGALQAGDFAPVFGGIALLSACSGLAFRRFRDEDGQALRGGGGRGGG